MPLEQTVTVLNNSGKIISTGKTLLSVFKEAQSAYKDKRSQIKSDRTLNRAATFDPSTNLSAARGLPRHHDPQDYAEEEDEQDYRYHDERGHRGHVARSEASSRRTSRRSRSVVSKRHHHAADDESQYGGSTTSRGSALTEKNLKAMTKVSAAAPSRPPPSTYRRPYAETMGLSKMDVTNAQMRDLAVSERRAPVTAVTRRRSCSEVNGGNGLYEQERQLIRAPPKEIDMNLAYGDLPPDLEHRHDLDPVYGDEYQAKTLSRKVEYLLDEANCLRHSAGTTIAHLQKNPDAAAAVACTLAELSKVVTKASPAVLAMLKSGSPAVWGLLASPQFMIGTGAVVGLTVIMFGGWKIVKKVKENQVAREALAYDGVPMGRPAPLRTQSEYSFGVDEALVVDDELSTIETWRRGIPANGDDESADLELITPTAIHTAKSMRGDNDDFDVQSRRSTRTSKTAKTSKSSKSRRGDDDSSERRSTRHYTTESVAGSERSRKTSGSSSSKRDRTPRTIEDGRSQVGDDAASLRPRIQRQGSNMLKALFKDKREGASRAELVRA